MRACRNCARCLCVEGGDGPFSYLDPGMMRDWLDASCGICTQSGEEPIVVYLGFVVREMPCGGDFWEAR